MQPLYRTPKVLLELTEEFVNDQTIFNSKYYNLFGTGPYQKYTKANYYHLKDYLVVAHYIVYDGGAPGYKGELYCIRLDLHINFLRQSIKKVCHSSDSFPTPAQIQEVINSKYLELSKYSILTNKGFIG